MGLELEFDGQPYGASISLPDGTKSEEKAADELKSMMELTGAVERMKESGVFSAEKEHSVIKAAVIPDFHKGAGIPIGAVLMIGGFVIPQAMGNDVNRGIRLYTTDLREEEPECCLMSLLSQIRRIFFEGGHSTPMNGIQREAMLQHGLTGLLETSGEAEGRGVWSFYDRGEQEKALEYMAFRDSLYTIGTESLGDFIGVAHTLSYNDQIGSIGGGNYFVEMQCVAGIYDGRTANAWGARKGGVLVMIHPGFLTTGHQSGRTSRVITKKLYPRGVPHPDNGVYLLPGREKMEMNGRENVPVSGKADSPWQCFHSTTYNVANLGLANRLSLGLILQRAVTDKVQPYEMKLLYDSPHNFIQKEGMRGRNYLIRRKGACSARGIEGMEGTPFAYYEELVMIPGSMGSSSCLLRGMENPQSLWSASHEAGRRFSRGGAIHGNDREFKEFMKKFRTVTPIDPDRSDLKGRSDILKKWEETVHSGAPYAYKDIHRMVKVHEEYGMAGLVARIEPVFTMKTQKGKPYQNMLGGNRCMRRNEELLTKFFAMTPHITAVFFAGAGEKSGKQGLCG